MPGTTFSRLRAVLLEIEGGTPHIVISPRLQEHRGTWEFHIGLLILSEFGGRVAKFSFYLHHQIFWVTLAKSLSLYPFLPCKMKDWADTVHHMFGCDAVMQEEEWAKGGEAKSSSFYSAPRGFSPICVTSLPPLC